MGTLGCGVWESSFFVGGFSGEVITSIQRHKRWCVYKAEGQMI